MRGADIITTGGPQSQAVRVDQYPTEAHGYRIADSIVQLRSEMRDEFSAVREEMRELNDETRRHMRVLHEEVIGRLAIIQEGQPRRRRRKDT